MLELRSMGRMEMRLYAISPGDRSVGIVPERAVIELEELHDPEYIAMVMLVLQEAFAEIFDNVGTYIVLDE